MIKPFSNRVVVKPIEEDNTTESGLVIASMIQNKQVLKGEVIACGKGAVTMSGDLIPMETKVGDIVMYAKQNAMKVEQGTDEVHVLHETDLIGSLS